MTEKYETERLDNVLSKYSKHSTSVRESEHQFNEHNHPWKKLLLKEWN